MRLLNVRIGDEDERLVRDLRERGVSISDVVRDAIRSEARRLRATDVPDPEGLLAEMKELHPRPKAGAAVVGVVRSSDRRQVQDLIRRKLKRPR